MRNALVAALLLTPAIAMADLIGAFIALESVIGATAAAFVVTATSFLISNWAIVTLVAGTIYGRRKARKAAAAARAAFVASLQDRSVSALQAIPPWRIPYGEYVAGGDVVDILTSDKTVIKEYGLLGSQSSIKDDAYKHVVYHVAMCSIEDVPEVYIDGIAVGALDANGWATTGSDFASTKEVGRSKVFTTTVTLTEAVVTVVSCYETDATDEWLHTPVTPTLSNGNLTVTVPAGKTVTFNYTVSETSSSIRIKKFLDAAESKSTYLMSLLHPADVVLVTDSHLYGMAVVVITFDLTEQRFQDGSIIQRVTFKKKGKKVYDPRTGLTAWSANPALCIRDYLLGEYGYECTSADVDDDAIIAAANACDAQISLTVGGTTTTGATFVCNGEVVTDASQEAVLEDMAECMAGFTAYGAKWQVHAGVWTPPVIDLTDDDMDGQIGIVQAGAGVDELFNGARGTYVPTGKAHPTDCEPYQNAVFAAADGRALWTDFTLPFTDNRARAKNLFRIFVERNRASQVIQYPAKFRAFPVQVGDRVRVTSAEYGFAQKLYRVTDWQFGITSPVMLTLQEDAAEIYDLADAASADPTPNTNLPNPWVVSALTGVTATSSVDTVSRSGTGGAISPRVVVEWDAITDAYVKDGGHIELQWRRPAKDFERSTWPGDSEQAEIIGVNDAEPLVIRVRAVNSMGAVGTWVYIAHTVDGPTSVGTEDAEPDAWTEVAEVSASAVSVTGTSGVPTGTFTTIATYTFTPAVSGYVNIEFDGTVKMDTNSSDTGNSDSYASIATRLRKDSSSLEAATRIWHYQADVGLSKTIYTAVTRVRKVAVTGGVSTTLDIQGQRLSSTNTTTVDGTFKIEFVKR